MAGAGHIPPITKRKELSEKQRQVFDTLFQSSILLLEKQLIIACLKPEAREAVAEYYTKKYIAHIQETVTKPANASLPRKDLNDLLGAKLYDKDDESCLTLAFQGIYLATGDHDRFWDFMQHYLKKVLLAHPDLETLKIALGYVIEAATSRRITIEDTREYGTGLTFKTLGHTFYTLAQRTKAELATKVPEAGALDFYVLANEALALFIRYGKANFKIGLPYMLNMAWFYPLKVATSLPGIAVLLGCLYYYNKSKINWQLALLLVIALVIALSLINLFLTTVLIKAILPSSEKYRRQAAENLARLTELFRFEAMKVVHEGRVVTIHATRVLRVRPQPIYVPVADILPLPLPAAGAGAGAEAGAGAGVGASVPTGAASIVPGVTGNYVPVPKPTWRGAAASAAKATMVAPGAAPLAERTEGVICIATGIYVRLHQERLREQGAAESVIRLFTNALKPGCRFLSKGDKGNSGIKLLTANTVFLPGGEAATLKLKIIGREAGGARAFSHAHTLADGSIIHEFDTFATGNTAHR